MIRKLLLFGSVFIFVLIIILGVIIRLFTTPVIKNQLDQFIASNPSEIYEFSYEDLHIRLALGKVSIEGVKIKLKEGAKEKVLNHELKDIEELECSSIEIDLDLPAYIFSKRVVVEDIKILQPEISIFITSDLPDTLIEEAREPVLLEEIFTENFQALALDQFELQKASFTMTDLYKQQELHSMSNINVSFTDVLLDSSTVANEPMGITFTEFDIVTGELSTVLGGIQRATTSGLVLELNKVDDRIQFSRILLKDFEYWPVDEAIEELQQSKLRSLFGVKVDSLVIDNFDLGALLENRLELENLTIRHPSFLQHVNTNVRGVPRPSDSQSFMGDLLDEISIKELVIEQGTLELFNRTEDRSEVLVREVNVKFVDLFLDEKEKLRTLFTEGNLEMKNITSEVSDYYTINVSEADFNLKKGDIEFQNLQLVPQHSEVEFFEKIGFETDRFDMTLESLTINALNLEKLLDDFEVEASDVKVSDLTLDIYRNKWIDDPEFKYKPLPSRMIRELDIPIWIDTIFINNANITYRQLGDLVEYENEQPLQIRFRQMNGKLFTLTNSSEHLVQYPNLTLMASMIFMDSTILNAIYEFDINSQMDEFKVYGDLGFINTRSLEPILHNVLLVDIPDGRIYRGEFEMYGNDSTITGTLDLTYENLAVDLLKPKNPEKSSNFWNSIANSVIRKNNLKNRGKYIQGLVNAPRKMNKSVFNFTWQGIKSGIIYTVSPVRTGKMKGKKSKKSSNP